MSQKGIGAPLNWSEKAQQAAFQRYNKILEKDDQVFNEIYTQFEENVNSKFKLNTKKKNDQSEEYINQAHTQQQFKQSEIKSSSYNYKGVNKISRAPQFPNQDFKERVQDQKNEQAYDFEKMLENDHEYEPNIKRIQMINKKNQQYNKSPTSKMHPRSLSPPKIKTNNFQINQDESYFQKMNTVIEQIDKNIDAHQIDYQTITFKQGFKKEQSSPKKLVKVEEFLRPNTTAGVGQRTKYQSERQMRKIYTNDNELSIYRLTKQLSRISQNIENKKEEADSELQIPILYKQLLEMTFQKMNNQKEEFQSQENLHDQQISELKVQLEEKSTQIKQLKYDLEHSDQKCLMIFEKEKINLNQKVLHLQNENYQLQSEVKDSKKNLITAQGQQKQVYEKYQKQQSKLEELNEQISRELNERIEEEVKKNKKTQQNMETVIENYKNAIVSLKFSHERIEELEEKLQLLQSENQRLSIRGGANFSDLTPRPDLNPFYDLLLSKMNDDQKKTKLKQIQSNLKSKIIDFRQKSTKDHLNQILQSLEEYVTGLKSEIYKKNIQDNENSLSLGVNSINRVSRSVKQKKTKKLTLNSKKSDDDQKVQTQRSKTQSQYSDQISEAPGMDSQENISDERSVSKIIEENDKYSQKQIKEQEESDSNQNDQSYMQQIDDENPDIRVNQIKSFESNPITQNMNQSTNLNLNLNLNQANKTNQKMLKSKRKNY